MQLTYITYINENREISKRGNKQNKARGEQVQNEGTR